MCNHRLISDAVLWSFLEASDPIHLDEIKRQKRDGSWNLALHIKHYYGRAF